MRMHHGGLMLMWEPKMQGQHGNRTIHIMTLMFMHDRW